MTVNEIEISIQSTIGPQMSVPNVEYLLCNLVLKGIFQRKYSEEYGTGWWNLRMIILKGIS